MAYHRVTHLCVECLDRNNNFASLARLVDNIRTALVNSGIMKGAA